MGRNLKHLAIIPDGNRRFAKRLMEKPWKGHEWGTEKVEKVIEWVKDTDIDTVTFYALSWENLEKRPQEEFDYLMKIFKEKALEKAESDKVYKNGIRFKIAGDYSKLPDDVVKALKKLEKSTKDNNNFHINLAIAYSGRMELISAFKDIKEKGEDISQENIEKNLWIGGNPPDLVIRTGGEKRLSNFLLWQSAYSELYFIEKMWPDIEKRDIIKAIEEFKERERRFGR